MVRYQVTYSHGGDMAQIGGDAGGVDDIVEGELVDKRAGLEEEGQGLGELAGIWQSWRGTNLANAARGTENSYGG
jgi:hypothetical protein